MAAVCVSGFRVSGEYRHCTYSVYSLGRIALFSKRFTQGPQLHELFPPTVRIPGVFQPCGWEAWLSRGATNSLYPHVMNDVW